MLVGGFFASIQPIFWADQASRNLAARCEQIAREKMADMISAMNFKQFSIDVEKTLDWMAYNGGSCDCKILMNVDP